MYLTEGLSEKVTSIASKNQAAFILFGVQIIMLQVVCGQRGNEANLVQ